MKKIRIIRLMCLVMALLMIALTSGCGNQASTDKTSSQATSSNKKEDKKDSFVCRHSTLN